MVGAQESLQLTDVRFFRRSGPFALGDLAARVGGALSAEAPASMVIHDIAALDAAKDGDISVFSDSAHSGSFAKTHASAVLTSTKLSAHEHNGSWLLLVGDPRLAFTQIGCLFYPPNVLIPGAHPSATVDATATIGEGTQISAGAVVGAGVTIGARTRIDSNVVIGDGVAIGDDCVIGANSSINHALLGSRVQISTNVSIGGAGFGFVISPKGLLRMSQLGRVVVGDDVEIGQNCTIDRGTMSDTSIGAGTKMDNLVHIAHNVVIGRNCAIAGQVGIAGSTTLGDGVVMGGQVGIADHLTIGSYARIAAKSGVIRDVAAREVVGGYPAMPTRQWHRQTVALARLAEKKKNDE